MILAIVGMLLSLTFLVVIHELGHFIAARHSNIAVREFGVGFPPRLFKIKRKKTIYSVNALPIGGFVSIKGEDGQESGEDSFTTKPARVKLKVLLAGVSFNFVFAYIVILLLLLFGVSDIFQFKLPDRSYIKPIPVGQSQVKVLVVSEGSAAAKIGIQTGDKIISIDSKTVNSQQQLRDITAQNPSKNVEVVYVHGDSTKTATAQLQDVDGVGKLGVVSVNEQKIRYSLLVAPIAAILICFNLIWMTLAAFGNFIVGLVTNAQVSENVTGPIGITAAIPKIRLLGLDYLALLLAQISLSLAVVNSLPISPLDGGKALIVFLKRIGLGVGEKFERNMQYIGFGFLLILMAVVTISDIVRLR